MGGPGRIRTLTATVAVGAAVCRGALAARRR